MTFFLIIIIVGYIGLVIYAAKVVVLGIENQTDKEVHGIKYSYENLMKDENKVGLEKRKREEEASDIFTLYEMTKDITKSFSEKEAFEILEYKLRENVRLDECEVLDPASEKINQYKKNPDYFLFTLKSKRRKFGVLAIKGLAEEDQEKVMILGHQCALVHRRIKLYQEVENLAITDSLTILHTRRYLMERFEEELQRSAARGINLSFLMIDVDHFKKFNDRYGHLTGDKILREIGNIIQENIREIDIAGRYGGEEFCVVLPDTGRDGASFVAERIRKATEKAPIKAYDAKVKATVSIGMATFPQDGKITSELIDKADWALYRAKKAGRNLVRAFKSQ